MSEPGASQRRRFGGTGIVTLVVAGVALLAAGITVGVLLVPEPVTTVASGAPGAASLAVATEQFDDAQNVSALPVFADAAKLTVLDSGRVTRSTCSKGAVIASGSSPMTIDDRPVIALATSVPLWRDLGPGTRGADVAALQSELARLGYGVSVDGDFGTNTRAGVNALLSAAGVSNPSGTLSTASVLWLPSASVTVDSCAARVGDYLVNGELATAAGGLVQLQLSVGTSGFAKGTRTVRYHDVSAPVADGGSVTDPAFLEAIAASPELKFALSAQGTGNLTLAYVLAAPLEVVVLPPSALFGLSGELGCVVGDGIVRPVTVVSSSLGQTLVRFGDGPPPARVDTVPGDAVRSGGCA